MQIIPESIRSLWEEWEVRVLVLLSLLWQVILIILGNRRKCSGSDFISFTVWIMYLSADWLATVSLGNLANNQGGDAGISKSKIESKDQLLQALWAPFLLLHLGGPDTITAYALEDNNLWLRHLLGLLVQVSVAFYVFLLSWGNNALTFIAIPVFVSGIIKYSERTWALKAAAPDQFQDARVSSVLKHFRGKPELESVHKGHFLLPLLARVYADQSLKFIEGRRSFRLLVGEDDDVTENRADAFDLVEVQLGFLFDVLYTKASIIYKRRGLVLRLVSVLSIVAALVAFHIVMDDTYSRVDVVITYFLFAGAVSLEVFAFVSLILSDWTMHWLTKGESRLGHFVYSCISRCRPILCHEKRWSGYMGQHSMVDDFWLKETKSIGTNRFQKIYFEFNLLRRRRQVKVDDAIKSFIFRELIKMSISLYTPPSFEERSNILKELLSHRGDNLAKKYGGVISHSCEAEFGLSILLWHVATDICYYSNRGYEKIANHKAKKKCEASKKISDYLLYIRLRRPSMLPNWIDRVTNVRDTFKHAIMLFHSTYTSFALAWEDLKMESEMLYEGCFDAPNEMNTSSFRDYFDAPNEMKNSSFGEACRLAFQLEKAIHEENELWEVICGVWIEMLTYAASHCDWGSHAHHLRNGGELLTHVGLLIADLGLSKHFE